MFSAAALHTSIRREIDNLSTAAGGGVPIKSPID
jgi:hypothetical protein